MQSKSSAIPLEKPQKLLRVHRFVVSSLPISTQLHLLCTFSIFWKDFFQNWFSFQFFPSTRTHRLSNESTFGQVCGVHPPAQSIPTSRHTCSTSACRCASWTGCTWSSGPLSRTDRTCRAGDSSGPHLSSHRCPSSGPRSSPCRTTSCPERWAARWWLAVAVRDDDCVSWVRMRGDFFLLLKFSDCFSKELHEFEGQGKGKEEEEQQKQYKKNK